MRNVIVHYGIAVAILLFAASPFIMATADGMVIYFLGVALIASVSLALANRPSEHVLGWNLTFASICITIACWRARCTRSEAGFFPGRSKRSPRSAGGAVVACDLAVAGGLYEAAE